MISISHSGFHNSLMLQYQCCIQDKIFKNAPSKICGRQPLKNLKCLKRPYHFKIFKGCLPQISFGPFFVPYFVPYIYGLKLVEKLVLEKSKFTLFSIADVIANMVNLKILFSKKKTKNKMRIRLYKRNLKCKMV